MKLILGILLSYFFSFSHCQDIDFEAEKEIIRETLSQYFDTNPNSIASFVKGKKGYELTEFMMKMAIAMEEDLSAKEELQKELDSLEYYSDFVSNALKTKKIKVQIIDTIYSYKYIPATKNLQNETEWEENYQYLLPDFTENNLARLDTIIVEEYIDLIKKQIHYKGENRFIPTKELNNSHYQFETNILPCNDEFCFKADKVYSAVFNEDFTKGCYLFSFYCQENEICRSFIFIKKQNDKWIYVDGYPSWLVDEA